MYVCMYYTHAHDMYMYIHVYIHVHTYYIHECMYVVRVLVLVPVLYGPLLGPLFICHESCIMTPFIYVCTTGYMKCTLLRLLPITPRGCGLFFHFVIYRPIRRRSLSHLPPLATPTGFLRVARVFQHRHTFGHGCTQRRFNSFKRGPGSGIEIQATLDHGQHVRVWHLDNNGNVDTQ